MRNIVDEAGEIIAKANGRRLQRGTGPTCRNETQTRYRGRGLLW